MRNDGRTTLDSLRAIVNNRRSPVTPTTRTILVGYSGGAIASTWPRHWRPSKRRTSTSGSQA